MKESFSIKKDEFLIVCRNLRLCQAALLSSAARSAIVSTKTRSQEIIVSFPKKNQGFISQGARLKQEELALVTGDKNDYVVRSLFFNPSTTL
mmetsp:Transcript_7726/g.11810  ORF Transcript_7726/g.11810 Transcript_7726/m.11810 type:complete len:92 (-) Transcript_7726:1705-1980(-)